MDDTSCDLNVDFGFATNVDFGFAIFWFHTWIGKDPPDLEHTLLNACLQLLPCSRSVCEP